MNLSLLVLGASTELQTPPPQENKPTGRASCLIRRQTRCPELWEKRGTALHDERGALCRPRLDVRICFSQPPQTQQEELSPLCRHVTVLHTHKLNRAESVHVTEGPELCTHAVPTPTSYFCAIVTRDAATEGSWGKGAWDRSARFLQLPMNLELFQIKGFFF